MSEILYKQECFAIQGALFEVHNQLGSGFSESVYQEALKIELISQAIPFKAQPELSVNYKGSSLNCVFKPDFICYDKIILELKALSALTTEHEAQVINYLKVANMKLGLLVNFGSTPKATVKRFVL